MRIFAGRDLGELPVDRDANSVGEFSVGDGVKFQLTTNPRNGRVDVFAARPASLPASDVKQIHGRLLRATGKEHGLVDDVYVPSHLVKTVGEEVEDVGVVAVYARHPEKGYGWKALRISAAR